MKKKEEYFKVCNKIGDRYFSAITTGWYLVWYKPNKWVKAKKGKLFVFNSRRAANKFSHSFGTYVLPCEVKGVTKPVKVSSFCSSWAVFWNKIIKNGSLPLAAQDWYPSGTLWVDAVKILPDKKGGCDENIFLHSY